MGWVRSNLILLGYDSSVQGLADNMNLDETRYDPQVDTIFDFTSGKTDDSRHLSVITLSNGDKYYGPSHYRIPSVRNDFRHVGHYTNGVYTDHAPLYTPGPFSRANDNQGAAIYGYANLYGLRKFYYEPVSSCYVNEIVVTFNPFQYINIS